MSAGTDTGGSGRGPVPRPAGTVRVAVGYGFAAAGAETALEERLHRHASACGLHLSQVLIDTPGSARRALDGLMADLARRRTRHVLVPDLADLGDDGTGWLVSRVLESEFQAVVHTFAEP
jgi:hypothetical protein